MGSAASSIPSLLKTDPYVAQNFFVEIDGSVLTYLSGISGLDIELDVVSATQVGDKGIMQMVKTLGSQVKAGDLQLTRMASTDMANDALWKWFNSIRGTGMPNANRTLTRKNGSIVIYDSKNVEVGRFNFYNAWPSKIATDAFSADSNDPVKETITLVCERLERVK